jgi:hypothetical protein
MEANNMSFLNALFNYSLLYVCFVAVVVAGTMIGKTLRVKKNSKIANKR